MAIRPQHTSSAYINQLPPELLAGIFESLQVDASRHSEQQRSDSVSWSASWITITHVCAYWRKIALECPNLWTRPAYHQSGCAMAMVSRAGSLPLSIRLSLTPAALVRARWSSKNGFGVVGGLKDWAQVEDLALELLDNRGVLLHPDIPGLTDPAPILRTFLLSSLNCIGGHVPSDLFAGSAPMLEELRFVDWLPPVTPQFMKTFPNLTVLEISASSKYISDRWEAGYSVTRVLEAITVLPKLEILRLEDLFTPLPIGDNPSAQNHIYARLPKLKVLSLCTTYRAATAFLSQLDYPKTTRLRLNPWSEQVSGDALLDRNLGARRARDLICTVINHADLSLQSMGILLHENDEDCTLSLDSSSSPLMMTPTPEALFTFVLLPLHSEVLVAIPIHDMKSLTANAYCSISGPTAIFWGWASVLLERVETVFLHPLQLSESFFDLLHRMARSEYLAMFDLWYNPHGDRSKVLRQFPSLKKLILEGWDLASKRRKSHLTQLTRYIQARHLEQDPIQIVLDGRQLDHTSLNGRGMLSA